MEETLGTPSSVYVQHHHVIICDTWMRSNSLPLHLTVREMYWRIQK